MSPRSTVRAARDWTGTEPSATHWTATGPCWAAAAAETAPADPDRAAAGQPAASTRTEPHQSADRTAAPIRTELDQTAAARTAADQTAVLNRTELSRTGLGRTGLGSTATSDRSAAVPTAGQGRAADLDRPEVTDRTVVTAGPAVGPNRAVDRAAGVGRTGMESGETVRGWSATTARRGSPDGGSPSPRRTTCSADVRPAPGPGTHVWPRCPRSTTWAAGHPRDPAPAGRPAAHRQPVRSPEVGSSCPTSILLTTSLV